MTWKFFTIKPSGSLLVSKLMCSTIFRIITIDGSPTACGSRRMRLTILQLAPRNSMHSQNLAACAAEFDVFSEPCSSHRNLPNYTRQSSSPNTAAQRKSALHAARTVVCQCFLSPPLDAREIKTRKQDLQLAPWPQQMMHTMQLAPRGLNLSYRPIRAPRKVLAITQLAPRT